MGDVYLRSSGSLGRVERKFFISQNPWNKTVFLKKISHFLTSTYRNEFEIFFSDPRSCYWIHVIKSLLHIKDDGLHLEKYLGT